MKTSTLFIVFTLVTWGLIAQINETRMVPNPLIRIIDGKEYLAKDLRASHFRVLSNAAPNVLAVQIGKSESERPRVLDRDDPARIGAYTPPLATWTNYSGFAYVTNAQGQPGKTITLRALKLGKNYDCGSPKLCPVGTSSREAGDQIQEDPALERDQSLAGKGDPEYLLRMGDRYALGKGVPKDLAKAREYYHKAIDKGSSEAKSALKNLPQ